MRDNTKHRVRAVLLAAALVLLPATATLAQANLESAKAAGVVGERADGLLGLVKGASPDVKQMVDEINARRLSQYKDIAARNGTSIQAVQAIAGQKLVSQSPAGTYVMDASGSWRVK